MLECRINEITDFPKSVMPLLNLRIRQMYEYKFADRIKCM